MQLPQARVMRGVNLGNWLLLEKWMRPSLFAGTNATDEFTLCRSLGENAERVMLDHRDTFITESDFVWLKHRGLNAVRIPFGYWLFDPDPPFVSSPAHLDMAVALAEKHGLTVLLDLHGLPGSQGPNDHTGRADHFQWHRDPRNLERSLDVIEQIAQRYAGRKSVTGFSIINEPEPAVGREFLIAFYESAYERVRRHMSAEEVAFVIAAYPEGEMSKYHDCLPHCTNVWTDVHLYQSFGDWSEMPLLEYLSYPLRRQVKLRKYIQTGSVIVGEWSMSIAPPQEKLLQEMPAFRRLQVMRMHGAMQLAMLEEFAGWFFWSYKVDNRTAWSFRSAVECGWLPEQFGSADAQAVGMDACSAFAAVAKL